MLKNKPKDKTNIAREGIPRNVARFGSSLFLKGELSGDEDLVIEGQFQGKIDLGNHNILVSPGGKVEADIRAKNITIKGSIKGNIYASGKVFISKEGQMKGDINSPKISIMEGAQFRGGVKMKNEIKEISLPEEKADILPIQDILPLKEEEEKNDKTAY